MAQKRLSPYHFFLKHAGYSYDPKTETRAQGRRRCAKKLAGAEITAQAHVQAHGWAYRWEIEQENPRDVFGEPDPVNGPFYNPDNEFWCCSLWRPSIDEEDTNRMVCIASLGMIEAPSNEYRRVIEAELALEVV